MERENRTRQKLVMTGLLMTASTTDCVKQTAVIAQNSRFSPAPSGALWRPLADNLSFLPQHYTH